ncbi:Os09g0387000, partial [Oryza sativa Japonica Group]
ILFLQIRISLLLHGLCDLISMFFDSCHSVGYWIHGSPGMEEARFFRFYRSSRSVAASSFFP